jgi:hypothetical protein
MARVIDPEGRFFMGGIAEDHSAENRASTLSWAGKTFRPSRSGLPFGRVPQSNRSMDKPTFAALNRVLGFMSEHMLDVDVPQSIEEDGLKVKAWIDNYQQHIK